MNKLGVCCLKSATRLFHRANGVFPLIESLQFIRRCIANVEIFALHYICAFLRSKKLAQIYQHAKIKLIHCLLLPKFAVHESYKPHICQNGTISQTFTPEKYPHLRYNFTVKSTFKTFDRPGSIIPLVISSLPGLHGLWFRRHFWRQCRLWPT